MRSDLTGMLPVGRKGYDTERVEASGGDDLEATDMDAGAVGGGCCHERDSVDGGGTVVFQENLGADTSRVHSRGGSTRPLKWRKT